MIVDTITFLSIWPKSKVKVKKWILLRKCLCIYHVIYLNPFFQNFNQRKNWLQNPFACIWSPVARNICPHCPVLSMKKCVSSRGLFFFGTIHFSFLKSYTPIYSYFDSRFTVFATRSVSSYHSMLSNAINIAFFLRIW